MASKSSNIIGIEYDTLGIRAARIEIAHEGGGAAEALKKGHYKLVALEELCGSFLKDDDIISGLKKIKEKMNIGPADRIVSCVSGKQVFVTQIPFKRLPQSEMLNALKLEIRKNMPFDISGASIDYQILPDGDRKSDTVQVLVTAVTHLLLTRHLQIMAKAGLKPMVVDTLPSAVANALSLNSAHVPTDEKPVVAIHIGSQVCTLIIECKGIAFFHRNIYFAADELYGVQNSDPNMAITEREKVRRLGILTEEVVRSVSYYEKTNEITGIQRCCLMGDFTDKPELLQALAEKSGLQGTVLNLCHKYAGALPPLEPGKYALPVALAMRHE